MKLLLTSQRELLASRALRSLQCSDCSWRKMRKIQKASLSLQRLQVGPTQAATCRKGAPNSNAGGIQHFTGKSCQPKRRWQKLQRVRIWCISCLSFAFPCWVARCQPCSQQVLHPLGQPSRAVPCGSGFVGFGQQCWTGAVPSWGCCGWEEQPKPLPPSGAEGSGKNLQNSEVWKHQFSENSAELWNTTSWLLGCDLWGVWALRAGGILRETLPHPWAVLELWAADVLVLSWARQSSGWPAPAHGTRFAIHIHITGRERSSKVESNNLQNILSLANRFSCKKKKRF